MTWIQLDVTEVDSVRALERQLQDTWGRLDVFVSNAGIISRERPLLETSSLTSCGSSM
jgi:NAD(P)-dependent dehydrogenase (short-subunit alcohol dehydrogenase family)